VSFARVGSNPTPGAALSFLLEKEKKV